MKNNCFNKRRTKDAEILYLPKILHYFEKKQENQWVVKNFHYIPPKNHHLIHENTII
jgi:hypothetical protein